MIYEVIKERRPEDYTSVFTCKVRKWHSFISGFEEVREYLAISNARTTSGGLEIYEAPSFKRILGWEEDRLWNAVKRYREKQDALKRSNKVKEKYSEYFEPEREVNTAGYRDK